MACAAIGGSHLVWSTRAGAQFGWSLLWLVLLVNLLKFPFFLYGQRYTSATGESLLAGYRRQGVVYVWIFLLINILTGAINIAGVGMVSGALLAGYGIQGVSVQALTVGLMVVSAATVQSDATPWPRGLNTRRRNSALSTVPGAGTGTPSPF